MATSAPCANVIYAGDKFSAEVLSRSTRSRFLSQPSSVVPCRPSFAVQDEDGVETLRYFPLTHVNMSAGGTSGPVRLCMYSI